MSNTHSIIRCNFMLCPGNPTPCSLLSSSMLKAAAEEHREDAWMETARPELSTQLRGRWGEKGRARL